MKLNQESSLNDTAMFIFWEFILTVRTHQNSDMKERVVREVVNKLDG